MQLIAHILIEMLIILCIIALFVSNHKELKENE
jgi:hypothetical protein